MKNRTYKVVLSEIERYTKMLGETIENRDYIMFDNYSTLIARLLYELEDKVSDIAESEA